MLLSTTNINRGWGAGAAMDLFLGWGRASWKRQGLGKIGTDKREERCQVQDQRESRPAGEASIQAFYYLL